MKGRKILFFAIILIILAILIFVVFFSNGTFKNGKIGNNSSNQEIIENILNISSYNAKINVEVNSNKNTNRYIIKQDYISPDILNQEVIEPENICGVKIIKNRNQLRVENTKLNLTKIFENYKYMTDNCLDLISFIKDYKEDENSKYEEKNNEIILITKNKLNNKYIKNKRLYIDKNTGKPTKMEIEDDNKNNTIYILYNEVNLNSNQQSIVAFYKTTNLKDI